MLLTSRILFVALALAPLLTFHGAALAQDAPQGPMSAIDWLSDSITLPAPTRDIAILPPATNEPAVSQSASVAEVTMSLLEAPVLDAVGLFPASTTGLPTDLWGASRPDDLARRIASLELDLFPAQQALLQRLLLTELEPPKGARAGEDRLFLARVDRLLATGALDQAEALLQRAGSTNPRVFRRAFDTSLLLGEEDRKCQTLRNSPDLSPTYPARVFCLARSGDWDAAVLTLETGRALGYISDDYDALLARFLDPELFEGQPPLAQPIRPSPLSFRMFEAIGQPIQTTNLPLAFAQADLRANVGWKARAEAGERLARVGSVSENQLLGLYSEQKPSASGGIWDRMTAVRRVEAALETIELPVLEDAVIDLQHELNASGLEVSFARIFGPDLAEQPLTGDASKVALRMGLLSDQYEEIATLAAAEERDEDAGFLIAIAQGQVTESAPSAPHSRAVFDGFSATDIPIRLRSLVDQNRLGEAILRAMELISEGSDGNYDEISDALAFFRLVGLEQVARQTALEFLILERRG